MYLVKLQLDSTCVQVAAAGIPGAFANVLKASSLLPIGVARLPELPLGLLEIGLGGGLGIWFWSIGIYLGGGGGGIDRLGGGGTGATGGAGGGAGGAGGAAAFGGAFGVGGGGGAFGGGGGTSCKVEICFSPQK